MSSSSPREEGRAVPHQDLPPVALTVAGVARRLGVAPATLRTWDRRYGLGPSEHAAGAHRRYTPADVARLEVMRRLVLEGVSPGDAARAALAGADTSTSAIPASDDAIASVTTLPGGRPVSGSDATRGTAAPTGQHATGHGGGGQVIPIPGGSSAARGLARAAMGLDAPAVADIINTHIAQRGVVPTWDDLLVPVLVGVGLRYEATGRGIEVEHLLSEQVASALRASTAALTGPRNLQPVLLASADEEQHTLPLHAVAAALAERQVATRMLGARVPRGALAAAVRRSGPVAVMVWSQIPGTAHHEQVADLRTVRPAPVVLVGGPGWGEELPEGVARVTDLADAVTRLVAAALV